MTASIQEVGLFDHRRIRISYLRALYRRRLSDGPARACFIADSVARVPKKQLVWYWWNFIIFCRVTWYWLPVQMIPFIV